MFKLSIRMRKKIDLNDFERGVVVGVRWVKKISSEREFSIADS